MKCKHSVDFIEYLVKDNYYYIVMELCDGDLNDLLKKNKDSLDLITITKILKQLKEVLNIMHKKNNFFLFYFYLILYNIYITIF